MKVKGIEFQSIMIRAKKEKKQSKVLTVADTAKLIHATRHIR